MVEHGAPSFVNDALVTGGFFDVLGVRPFLGRTITRADDVEGAENVLVISHGLWQRRYGGSREVLGRRVDAQRAALYHRWRHAAGRRLPEWRRGVENNEVGSGDGSVRRCRTTRGQPGRAASAGRDDGAGDKRAHHVERAARRQCARPTCPRSEARRSFVRGRGRRRCPHSRWLHCWRRRVGAAHRERERRQPLVDARRSTPGGASGPRRTRRRTRHARASAVRRKPRAGARGRGRGSCGHLVESPGADHPCA